MTTQEVERLLQRFMDGTSTLEEEAQLADFFRTHEVAGEWATYKDMFALFDEGKVEVEEKKITAWWKYAGIAAAIILLLGLGFYFNSRNDEKPHLIAQADTIKTAPQTETKKVEEQPLKPVEQDESADMVTKVKEIQRITRPQKTYMAKLSPMKEEKAQPKQKNALPDTIIFTESPYHIASEELSEPEIRERDLPQYASSQSDDLDYEELKREIQQRGERMIKNIELAFNPEEDF
ncbi:MAG: hypothetical protein IJ550_01310 [Bacteroidaceae bacterium]|nr:hypothetical protein [Bacteroidaceae bacterium]